MPRIHRFPTGKAPPETLRRHVFTRLGAVSSRILQGPNLGEDGAIIDMGDRVLVVATDPITGAEGNVGWLVVHVNANDVASCGVRPQWFLCVTMLPEGAGETVLDEIMEQVDVACREVGVSLIGGHTETTPGLDRPILVGFMMGETAKGNYVTTGGALPGDAVIITKAAGIEGTAVLAADLVDILKDQVDDAVMNRAQAMLKSISVVPEAMKAMEVGGVHALHDPTEGGVLNGIWEMVEASNTGVLINEKAIPIFNETRVICEVLGVDPLKLLGSGALLIVADPNKVRDLVYALKEMKIEATVIGEILSDVRERILLRRDGSRVTLEAVKQDHLYKILDKHGLSKKST